MTLFFARRGGHRFRGFTTVCVWSAIAPLAPCIVTVDIAHGGSAMGGNKDISDGSKKATPIHPLSLRYKCRKIKRESRLHPPGRRYPLRTMSSFAHDVARPGPGSEKEEDHRKEILFPRKKVRAAEGKGRKCNRRE